MNPHESLGDFMIYNPTNFIFYDNNNDSYDKPWQNLLHKISSAYMTKPFGVVKIESGARTLIFIIAYFYEVSIHLCTPDKRHTIYN